VQENAPVLRPRLLPANRVNELGRALYADVQVLTPLGGRMLGRGLVGTLPEVDDLDRLSAGKNHALDEVGLLVVVVHWP
jgi:hypothetical protein